MKINLEQIRKKFSSYDKKREKVIRSSRKIIQKSKTAIGSIHRDTLPEAAAVLKQMKEDVAGLKKESKGKLQHEGIFKVAIQEYVEALSLYEFVKNDKFLVYSEEFEDPEFYLMGLCDLSGELVRKAINSCIKENYPMAVKIRKFLEQMYIELSKFDFRNGELRRKYDGIKYDIRKLDDLVFQLKMKDKV
ncbi:hypothetical protein GOV09_04445 [Candidatus Woesearchaeota archaeon]|nr:hypothetical protein [Candidatus Woesearchaeota archaeon]